MKEREDFFSYYRTAKNNGIEIDSATFKVYEDLLFEALDFFEAEDYLDGKFYSKAFRLLYLEETEGASEKKSRGKKRRAGKIDFVSAEVGIDQKTLYTYRLRFDSFALFRLEKRGFILTSGKNRPIQITKPVL
ncbi:MAG: hypothetical protein FWD58_08880 [Firmicutes bacterium]|nr:hypothetical protein [Bacillota bacterium]